MLEDSALFRGLPTPETLGFRILTSLRKVLRLSSIAHFRRTDNGYVLELCDCPAVPGHIEVGRVVGDMGAAAGVVSSGTPLLFVPDQLREIRVPYFKDSIRLGGAMAVPVGSGLIWADRVDGPIDHDEFETFLDSCSGFEQQNLLIDRIHEAADQVQDLTETVEGARSILSSDSERTCVPRLAESSIQLSRSTAAFVVFTDPGVGSGTIVSGAGEATRGLVGRRATVRNSLVGLAVRSGESVPTTLRYFTSMGDVIGPETPVQVGNNEPIFVQPLGSERETLGALVLIGGDFSRMGVLHGVRTLSDCMSLLVYQFRLRERVAADAMLDGLTGLLNRRAFMSRVNEAVMSSIRHDQGLCLLMIDADHFKRINDEYGHPVGDIALRFISETIKKSLRGSDFAGRYGGEEFVVGLPMTGIDGARIVAERIRQVCDGTPIPIGRGTIKVSVSIGISLLMTGMSRSDELIARADNALYEAKNTGRNRVVVK